MIIVDFLYVNLSDFLNVSVSMIHGTNVLLNQTKLWYNYRYKVHFEWYFRWCLWIPKHIETPTIFRNIIFHECSLNMKYQWDIHGVSAYLISHFSRSDMF